MADIDAINKLLQSQLAGHGWDSVWSDDAAKWLDEAGLLEDDFYHQALSRLCREGRIEGVESLDRGPGWPIWRTPKAEELLADREALREWLANRAREANVAGEIAASLRRLAEDLVNDPSGQEPHRADLEHRLAALRVKLNRQVEEVKPLSSEASLFSHDLVTRYARQLLDPAAEAVREDVPESVRLTAAWPQLEQERSALKGVVEEGFESYEEARIAAAEAADRANKVADEAMSLSARRFVKPWEPRSSQATRAAGAPFAAFLVVAGLGAAVPPTPVATSVSCAVLLLATGFAFAVAWRQKARARSIATVGVGSSLAVFTAAYLVSSWADPASITLGMHPIAAIGEAALLSLTVGATGGTIGIELAGVARVIAFVQILLTVTAVATALTWGWHRLVQGRGEDRPRQPG